MPTFAGLIESDRLAVHQKNNALSIPTLLPDGHVSHEISASEERKTGQAANDPNSAVEPSKGVHACDMLRNLVDF